MKIATMHIGQNSRVKSREYARLLREQPEEWQRRHREQVQLIQVAGYLAYIMVAIGILLWLLSMIT
jgi:hypothetical protein